MKKIVKYLAIWYVTDAVLEKTAKILPQLSDILRDTIVKVKSEVHGEEDADEIQPSRYKEAGKIYPVKMKIGF